MISENIYSHDRMIELRIGRLQNFVISVLFIPKRIQSPKQKLEDSAQIFGTWRRHKNITETVNDRRSDTYAQTGWFAATSTRSQTYRALQVLLRYFVHHLHDTRSLIISFTQIN